MDNANLPLVSVPVVTYNSSKTIIETLDSIYNQTYPNIELIVSDDCSTDNTVELVRSWVKKHEKRFTRTEIITVEKNTGISANLNRAESACIGEWIKSMAGDDIMLPNCIQKYISYTQENPTAVFIFCRVEAFGKNKATVDRMNKFFKYEFFTEWNTDQKLGYLLGVDNCIPAVSFFVNVKKAAQYGVVDDPRVPNIEDHPMWINLLKAGAEFHFVDEVLIKYRITETSLSTGTQNSSKFQKSVAARFVYYLYPTYRAMWGRRKAWYKYSDCRCIMGENVFFWKIIRRMTIYMLRI